MSHERSITIDVVQDGKRRYINIPTVYQGRQVGEEVAVDLFKRGVIKPLGGKSYDSLEEAMKAAKERSERVDMPRSIFNGR